LQYQSDESKWAAIGNIVKNVQKLTHRHHSFKDILVDLTIKPSTGYISAAIILAAAFTTVRFIGESLIRFVLDPMVVAVTVLTISFPCAATFAVLVKELGIVNMGKAFLIMVAAALITGGLLRLILM
jgi:Fe2+ transport system protein B